VRIIRIFAWLSLVSALSAATLSNPRRVGTDFEFSITGASNAIYAIETSWDLQNWTRVATNRQFGEVRMISIPASAQEEVYRARLLQRLFTGALGARESITFKGSGVTINSYDSRDPNYSGPDGRYDPNRFKDNGKVVCRHGPFDMQNGKIFGHVETGEASALTMTSGGCVGSIQWQLNVGTGIEPGWHTSTTSGEFSNIDAPTGGNPLPPKVGDTYVFTNANAIYRTDILQGSVVVKGTNVTVIVNNNYGVTDLVVENGASIKLYVNAADVALRGIYNKNLRAESFMYYGLPGNAIVFSAANGVFIGTIYAPAASVTFGGGGTDELDFIGAVVGRNINVNGKLNVHYDESLGVAGPEL
jgi:hypothetical protein